MGVVEAVRTAWRPVGGGRDRVVDASSRPWTTRSWRELSPSRPRVIHGCRRVHPRPPDRPSTELSPGVGEVCAQGDAERPIRHAGVVTPVALNRWSCPASTRGETRGSRRGDDVDHRLGERCDERRARYAERARVARLGKIVSWRRGIVPRPRAVAAACGQQCRERADRRPPGSAPRRHVGSAPRAAARTGADGGRTAGGGGTRCGRDHRRATRARPHRGRTRYVSGGRAA